MSTSKYKPPRTAGWHQTFEELEREFTAWGIRDWSATPNVMLSRVNSTSLSKQERAVTVTFIKDGKTVTLAMDQYDTATQNLNVLRLCISDMRMIERRGLQDTMQSAYMQLAGPAAGRDPWEVMGLRPGAAIDEIQAMYRAKAKNAHPDHGGSDEAMAELNAARDRLLAGAR